MRALIPGPVAGRFTAAGSREPTDYPAGWRNSSSWMEDALSFERMIGGGVVTRFNQSVTGPQSTVNFSAPARLLAPLSSAPYPLRLQKHDPVVAAIGHIDGAIRTDAVREVQPAAAFPNRARCRVGGATRRHPPPTWAAKQGAPAVCLGSRAQWPQHEQDRE